MLAFLGTPDFAVPVLEAVARRHHVGIVASRADRRRSRRGAPEPSPVKSAASRLDIPVTTRMADIVESGAELGVVVAFGRIVPAEVLKAVPMVNLHLSLLPRWRGAAPVQRAILEGDAETGVCVMQLDEGLDTGPVHACASTAVGENETASELTRRLVELGIPLLLEYLSSPEGEPRPQQGQPTYAEKITPADLRLMWPRPAEHLTRQVRVGGAWCRFRSARFSVAGATVVDADLPPGALVKRDGQVIAGTGKGGLRLDVVKPAGKREMDGLSWWNGAKPQESERLE